MPVAFLDLAQTCASIVATEILAGVVSLESRFEPLAIRIDGAPLSERPTNKEEAIKIASSLTAERHDIQVGLGGVGMEELGKLKLSISDAFDPCLNLQATAALLDGYYRLALRAGADPTQAEQVMLQSYYGRNDPSVGAMVQYNDQVREEVRRIGRTLATLVISDGGRERAVVEQSHADVAIETARDDRPAEETASWDVFSSRRKSSVLVFQSSQMEQSE
jgi:type IV secretion system protein VirB1